MTIFIQFDEGAEKLADYPITNMLSQPQNDFQAAFFIISFKRQFILLLWKEMFMIIFKLQKTLSREWNKKKSCLCICSRIRLINS